VSQKVIQMLATRQGESDLLYHRLSASASGMRRKAALQAEAQAQAL
jgi:hypothetical protein